MSRRRILTGILTLALLLVLVPVLPVRADLTPGHVDTGFFPGVGADDEVLTVALQADGKVLVGGDFTTVNTYARNRIARLDADGSVDTSFDPGAGADGRVRGIAVQPDGKMIIGGSFTTVDGVGRNRIARLNADGSVDPSFDPGPGADIAVRTVVLQPDGKILISGDFSTVWNVSRNHIARLNADGSLDTSFDPGAGTSATVYGVGLQPDGKVIIVGSFTTVDSVVRNRIARLNADGSLDTGFDPGAGANSWVNAVVVQPDGKVVVGGAFATVDSVSRNRIARLNADGSVDTGFDPGAGASAVVHEVALQTDGKVLVVGAFATMDNVSRPRIARLNDDGSLDTGFDPGAGADSTVWAMALQADGKVLVGGDFTTIDTTGRNRIARLNGDGTLDVGLDPGTGANSQVQAVVHQPDGKVLIGGYFTTVDSVGRNRIARLNANGSLDTSFDPGSGANNAVRAVALQPDGKVVIGGRFITFNSVGRVRVARLSATGAVDTSFDPGNGANDMVVAVAVHDNKVFIGGYFTTVDSVSRNRIARLNTNGSLDTGFNPGTGANNSVLALAVQPDGKVIIAGDFTTVNSVTRNRIARLNTNGSVDTSFDPGDGPNLLVRSVAIQPDGKVIIGGSFTGVAGVGRYRIARLNEDGTLDTSFDPGTGANSWVDAVAVQSDGKVLIGGDFTTVDNVACNRIARLNADGSVDTAFITSAGADDTVYDVAIQPDGKVLIGGDFNRRVARLNGATPPAITSGAALPPAEAGVNYNHTFTASGYPFAPMFYVAGGTVPPGLTLDATTGVLSGEPTAGGDYAFTVRACNHVAPCDTQEVTLTVEGGRVYLPLVVKDSQ